MTTSLSIRMAAPEDAPALLEIYRPYITDTAITTVKVMSTEVMTNIVTPEPD